MGFRRRPVVVAVALTALVVACEQVQLADARREYFSLVYNLDSPAALGLRVADWLALFALQAAFFWVALLSSPRARIACLAVFAAVTFFEYGHVKFQGILPTSSFLHTALTSVPLWTDAVDANVDWRALVPVGLFGAACVLVPAGHGAQPRRVALVLLLTLLAHSGYALAPLDPGKWSPPAGDVAGGVAHNVPPVTMQAFARSATLFAWTHAHLAWSGREQPAFAPTTASAPSRHLVLVIDETVAARRLTLNGHERPTTPWLDTLARRGRLTNWGIAASVAAASDPSVAALLTGLQALPDHDRAIFRRPTVFHYAKAMGFQTRLFDGQLALPVRFGLRVSDRRTVDDFRGTEDFGSDVDTDFRMARAVRTALRRSEPQFVVVLKRGIHSPYTRNYPPAQAAWGPEADGQTLDRDQRESADAYDNALRYNLDRFFREILAEDGSLPGAVLLYTADHGRQEATLRRSHSVPLLMFGDDRPRVDVGYRASHFNIFPTLLDLMGVPRDARPPAAARSLLEARATDNDRRLTIDGDIFGRESFQIVNFDEMPQQ
ncbi:MAG: sulfatase-like hydrolase/transferase [Vicinamibacterales bacterium]